MMVDDGGDEHWQIVGNPKVIKYKSNLTHQFLHECDEALSHDEHKYKSNIEQHW